MRTCMMLTLPHLQRQRSGSRRESRWAGARRSCPAGGTQPEDWRLSSSSRGPRLGGGAVGAGLCAGGGPGCRRSDPRRSRCRRPWRAPATRGTGFTRPPSTSRRPSRWAWVNRPGKGHPGRTASAVEPVRSTPRCPNAGRGHGGKGMSAPRWGGRKNCGEELITRSPLSMPPESLKSMNENTVQPVSPARPLPRSGRVRPARRSCTHHGTNRGTADQIGTDAGLAHPPMCAQPRADPLQGQANDGFARHADLPSSAIRPVSSSTGTQLLGRRVCRLLARHHVVRLFLLTEPATLRQRASSMVLAASRLSVGAGCR